MSDKRKIGRRGEGIAVAFLEENQYRILEQNYQKRCGEIDIVAEKDNVIVFVEVKLRKEGSLSSPEEGVTPKKKERIVETAKNYIYQHSLKEQSFRFDVIAIRENNDSEEITHYVNAFAVES